jgi:excisionase family DNA binding protein
MDTETLSIAEAAKVAGVSPKTIRRRISEGEYAGATLVENPNGTKQWRIPRAEVQGGVSKVVGGYKDTPNAVDVHYANVHPDTSETVGRLLDTIDRLTAEIGEARERAARAEAIAGLLQGGAPSDGLLTRLRRRLG